jgi:hypothetical protein
VKWQWERLGEELNLPLRAVLVGGAGQPYASGFFELSRPEVQLLAFKPAEHRPGWYVLRFQEIGGTEVRGVRLVTPLRVEEAVTANTVEEPGEARFDLSNFSMKPWETRTVMVRLYPGP